MHVIICIDKRSSRSSLCFGDDDWIMKNKPKFKYVLILTFLFVLLCTFICLHAWYRSRLKYMFAHTRIYFILHHCKKSEDRCAVVVNGLGLDFQKNKALHHVFVSRRPIDFDVESSLSPDLANKPSDEAQPSTLGRSISSNSKLLAKVSRLRMCAKLGWIVCVGCGCVWGVCVCGGD